MTEVKTTVLNANELIAVIKEGRGAAGVVAQSGPVKGDRYGLRRTTESAPVERSDSACERIDKTVQFRILKRRTLEVLTILNSQEFLLHEEAV